DPGGLERTALDEMDRADQLRSEPVVDVAQDALALVRHCLFSFELEQRLVLLAKLALACREARIQLHVQLLLPAPRSREGIDEYRADGERDEQCAVRKHVHAPIAVAHAREERQV